MRLFFFLCLIIIACDSKSEDTSKFTYVGSGRYVCSSGDACAHYKAIRDQQARREFDRKYEADRYERNRDVEYIANQRRFDRPVREFMK